MRHVTVWLLGGAIAACTPPPPASSPPAPAPSAPKPTSSALSLLPRTATTPEWTPVVHRTSASPMSLTASDGSALRLVAVEARTLVEDPLAFTEMKLTFDNPQGRRIEGRFEITLPPGAAISRFAMRIGDQWQEGEVVPRAKSQRAYEDFLHRGIDPALLEHAGGNRFGARVFPIEPNQTKELIIAYSQELTDDPVLVPLQGLPEVAKVDVQVGPVGADEPVQWLRRANYAPEGDFGLDASLRRRSPGLRSGELVLARVYPSIASTADAPDGLFVLLDTSASRAVDFDAQLAALGGLMRSLATARPDARVAVACFDQSQQLVYEGPASGFGDAALTAIRERGALGASDLPLALRWARGEADARSLPRLVVIGDGVTTAGTAGQGEVVAAVKAMAGAVRRVDAIALGGLRDVDGLQRVVSSLPEHGVVLDGARAPTELVRRLSLRAERVEVEVDGAGWYHPRVVDGVQPGDEVLVYATVDAGATPRVRLGGATMPLGELRPVEHTLLERSWAKARIDGLLDQAAREGESDAIDAQIVALSTKHRVLAPQTGLLVLETEADYERWSIDRRALTDILTIDGGRVVSKRREAPTFEPGQTPRFRQGQAIAEVELPTAPQPRASLWGDSIGESFGTGGLGLSGIGEGGGGTGIGLGSIGTIGHGAGTGTGQGFGGARGLAGTRRPTPPRIRMGATTVSGRLPPEVIQRIVRQNFGRFRLCYENGLRSNPNLQGRITLTFVINRAGEVSNVAHEGDLPDQGVQTCVARAFYGLSFPQPEGGIVTVRYPLTFEPGQPDPRPWRAPPPPRWQPPPPPPAPEPATPVPGQLGEVQQLIASRDGAAALRKAEAWHRVAPGDVLALVALGEALEATGDEARAARAYGSIVDLFPSRADLRRFAGNRLEALGEAGMLLALDTYREAVRQRPDHPSGHRLLAFAQLRIGDPEAAFATLEAALKRTYPAGRHEGVGMVLHEDLGVVAAVWLAQHPEARADVDKRLAEAGAKLETQPSLRFVLTWETDTNDVDLHVYDGKGHAGDYDAKLGAGLLLADVTTGYGPEEFRVTGPRFQRAMRYRLQAEYSNRGPMGYGMGKVQVLDHDGRGKVTFDDRPFVALTDGARVDLGEVRR